MRPTQYIVIGGSAGSFQTITRILEALPSDYPHTLFLALHRLKYVRKGFVEALSLKSSLPVVEPCDKDEIRSGTVYLAPANYHLLIEPGGYFALSVEESVNHSRPSIDLTFRSAAYSLKEKLTGIILSGANRDGADGLYAVKKHGGTAIVQNPDECQVRTMPSAALEISQTNIILTDNEIIDFLKKM